jgi:hypothetical protein
VTKPNIHLTNRSGYNHNILNGVPNEYSSKLNISPREIKDKFAFRQKGLTDIVNLQYHNGEHPNYDHRHQYIKDKMSFCKKRGQFTHLNDSSKAMGISRTFKHSGMSMLG